MTRRNPLLQFSLLLAAALFMTTACQSGSGDQADGQEEAATEAPAGLNALTDAEKAEGWTLLFDGQTLNGWHSYLRDTVAGWVVEDGAISAGGGGGDLVTDKDYRNFELSLEWKISKGGNSGIIYRIVEDPQYEDTYATGPEFQVIDDVNYADELKPTQMAGANYDMDAPAKKTVKPAGEWNEVRIVVNGNHVEHWLNGEKIVEYEWGSDAWKEKVANSKWKDYPGYGTGETGRIALQYHDHPVWYRNIKLKEM